MSIFQQPAKILRLVDCLTWRADRAATRLPGVFLMALALMSCAESVKHDEARAAKRALEFGRVAFVDKDLDRAYDLLAESGKRHVPREKFKQSLGSMHTQSFPTKLLATDYEPMADEKAIYIFVRGQNSEDQFQYRFTMAGTAASDYKVLKIDQGSGFLTLSRKKQAFKPPIAE
jgi:hypothetical protein